MSVDIKEMETLKCKIFKGDIKETSTKSAIIRFFNSKLDVIISDMAADTTGNKSLDSIRTNQLCIDIINFQEIHLNQKVY